MKAWATLGFFDDRGDGVIVELDTRTGAVCEKLRFTPPPMLRAPGKGFTGAAWAQKPGEELFVCGAAALFRFQGPSLVHAGTLNHPSFNDLHGLSIDGERLYVANTGLDTIEVFDLDGQFLGCHSFESPWLARERQQRRVPGRAEWARLRQVGWSYKEAPSFVPERPHGAYYQEAHNDAHAPFGLRRQRDFVHPNHVQIVEGRVLVTSLVRKSVEDLTGWSTAFATDAPPHDGQIADDLFWLTRIDGIIEARSLRDLREVKLSIDLTARFGIAGWCRGLLVTEDTIFVGFTEIRREPHHPWARADFCDTKTAVVALDRTTHKLRALFDLSHPTRHTKVFAVLEAP